MSRGIGLGLIFWAGVIASGFMAHSVKSDDAMTVCQLSHSHDVCFQALNR